MPCYVYATWQLTTCNGPLLISFSAHAHTHSRLSLVCCPIFHNKSLGPAPATGRLVHWTWTCRQARQRYMNNKYNSADCEKYCSECCCMYLIKTAEQQAVFLFCASLALLSVFPLKFSSGHHACVTLQTFSVPLRAYVQSQC